MPNRSFLVIGGANGIGLAITCKLLSENYDKVYVVDRHEPELKNEKLCFIKMNLLVPDFSLLDQCENLQGIIITAGFGRLTYFNEVTKPEIVNSFRVNTLTGIELVHRYYSRICSSEDFYCAIITSITGRISSPLYALYSATKAALVRFTEGINIELESKSIQNRILDVSPGVIAGTKFHDGENENKLDLLSGLATEILDRMYHRDTLYIPDYEKVYCGVLQRYNENPVKFGQESIQYKLERNQLNHKAQVRIGYLSGTFDLFHIGHLNILRNARECCDYLVVGIHPTAAHKGKPTFIPLDERVEIIKSISYVNEVLVCPDEDSDAYDIIKFDYLFVGSDYQGTARFRHYEEYFKGKGVQIIYFPYTQGTSSTELRQAIQGSLKID